MGKFFCAQNGGEKMRFEQVKKEYVDEALSIAVREYEDACKENNELIQEDFRSEIRGLLEMLFEKGLGKVAIEEEKVIGYLAFFGPIKGFHGLTVGAFSPLGGSGFTGEKREKLASRLFESVSSELMKQGILTFAISYYSYDKEIGSSLVLNGFGIRCSDAIMKLETRKLVKQNEQFDYMELMNEERKEIHSLPWKLAKHLYKAPTFYPTSLERFANSIIDENKRVFVAKERVSQQVVGYIMMENEAAETFVTGHQKMANICGAFVEEEHRGNGVAEGILSYICQKIEEEGYLYLGVDCETLNPTALRFWRKYFRPYTYSYIRRLDERVKGWEDYYNNFMQNAPLNNVHIL